MADKYINAVGLQAIKQWIEGKFALISDLTTLSGRVDDIEAVGGEPNVIDTVKVNNTALVPDASKAVNITVPTATSELNNDGDGESLFATQEYVAENGGKIDVIQVNGTTQTITNKTVNVRTPYTDSGEDGETGGTYYSLIDEVGNTFYRFVTSDNGYLVGLGTGQGGGGITKELVAKTYVDATFQTEAQVQALIDSELADITSIDFQVVSELPATGTKGVIYLLPNQTSPTDNYDEYIWVTPAGGTAHYEQIGTTAVDLSGYWSKEELVAMTTAEVNAILNA